MQHSSIDLTSLAAEAVRHLQALIAVDTTNPPGNEVAACRYIASALDREGIPSTILESAPGRGNLVARLPGDGSARPLLLLSHVDVVPSEPARWTVPPFAGDVRDGYVWGRGAVDTKNLTAWELAVFLALKRSGLALRRDVILAATADEEAGGAMGVGWLVREHPDLLDAECGINEGGGYDLVVGGRRFFTCQTAEKGLCRLRLRAHGAAGHGAYPHADNAVVHLADAVARVGRARLPAHRTPTVETLFRAVGAALGQSGRDRLESVWANAELPADGDGSISPLLLRQLDGMARSTATPTRLEAGTAVNVIPSEAVAMLDGRVVPGQTPEAFAAEVQRVAGDSVAVEVMETSPTAESPADGPLVGAMRAALERRAPDGELVPFMSLGATDSRYLRPRGVAMYGFKPVRQEPGAEVTTLQHNHDERLSVANVEFGLRVLWDTIAPFATGQPLQP